MYIVIKYLHTIYILATAAGQIQAISIFAASRYCLFFAKFPLAESQNKQYCLHTSDCAVPIPHNWPYAK